MTEIESHLDAVVFRTDKDGIVFALFPFIPGSPGYCTSYEHVGQHGSADYSRCIRDSQPATSGEYDALETELRNIGYNLKICKRKPTS